jgi:hypothetical protein
VQLNRQVDLGIIALWLAVALIAPPLCEPITGSAPDALSSASRYLAVAFPLRLMLALTSRPRRHEAWLFVPFGALTLWTIGFVRGFYGV